MSLLFLSHRGFRQNTLGFYTDVCTHKGSLTGISLRKHQEKTNRNVGFIIIVIICQNQAR
jgi:hypothetical protein